MFKPDEWKLKHPAKALLGPDIWMVPPGNIGQSAKGDPQPFVCWRLILGKVVRPGNQALRKFGHPGCGQSDQLGAFDQWVEISLIKRQLGIGEQP